MPPVFCRLTEPFFLGATAEASKPTVPELPCLSEQLALDELWDILGECLIELGKTSDNHAVLVLQPAVEAFFLVHGTEKQETSTGTSSSTAQAPQSQEHPQRLSSFSMDHFPPTSPGPVSPGPLSPSRQISVTSISSDLPSDTQKFLRFAGAFPPSKRVKSLEVISEVNFRIFKIVVAVRLMGHFLVF